MKQNAAKSSLRTIPAAAGAAAILLVCGSQPTKAQSIGFAWSGYAHDAQHAAVAPAASQPLNRILWRTAVDLQPQYDTNGELNIHYGSPLITRANTVIVPVKTGATNGFEVEALEGATGTTNWTLHTDYLLPPHNWVPGFSPALTPKNRLYFAGGGGTVFYCGKPDTTNGTPAVGRLAFYGLANYLAHTNAYLTNVFIDTPITSDRYGNIFFGFQVTGPTPLNLQGGIARIDYNGTGSWLAASNAAGDTWMNKVAQNCSPALSNDHRMLYVAVDNGSYNAGYLVVVDSRTLTPLGHARLMDVAYPTNEDVISDDVTASPTVGPDGDVYYGVMEYPWNSNHQRGWLHHFDSLLQREKTPGAFGWDATASVLPASAVPSYQGASSYLLVTKYNNYPEAGGDGINKIAVLDPHDTMTDPVTGATVMKEILTIAGPTPDPAYTNSHPNAVKEWCINSAAVDPSTKSVLANNEDGRLYRWDLAANALSETNILTTGIGEAYTPTLVGVDGTIYAINNAILFAVGH